MQNKTQLTFIKQPIFYSKYLAISIGLFHCFRLITGAIGVLFFLKRGRTLQELALLQICFSTTSLLTNYPTGILADCFGPKFFVLLSCIFMASYYFICTFTQSLYPLLVAYFFQACGLSCMMGASASWIAGWSLKEAHKNENYLNYLGHLKNEVQTIGGIISGLIGATLACFITENSYEYVFFITSVLMVLMFFMLIFIPDTSHSNFIKCDVISQTKQMIKTSFSNRWTVLFFLSVGLITALYQPLFHFWQPYFRDLNAQFFGDENMVFGLCFAAFNLSGYFVNRNIKLNALRAANQDFSKTLMMYTYLTFLAFLILSFVFYSFILSVLLFCILHGSLSVISTIVNDQYIKKENEVYKASTISLGEVFGRISSLCVLWIIYFFINTISINGVFFVSSCVTMFLIITLRKQNKLLHLTKVNYE